MLKGVAVLLVAGALAATPSTAFAATHSTCGDDVSCTVTAESPADSLKIQTGLFLSSASSTSTGSSNSTATMTSSGAGAATSEPVSPPASSASTEQGVTTTSALGGSPHFQTVAAESGNKFSVTAQGMTISVDLSAVPGPVGLDEQNGVFFFSPSLENNPNGGPSVEMCEYGSVQRPGRWHNYDDLSGEADYQTPQDFRCSAMIQDGLGRWQPLTKMQFNQFVVVPVVTKDAPAPTPTPTPTPTPSGDPSPSPSTPPTTAQPVSCTSDVPCAVTLGGDSLTILGAGLLLLTTLTSALLGSRVMK